MVDRMPCAVDLDPLAPTAADEAAHDAVSQAEDDLYCAIEDAISDAELAGVDRTDIVELLEGALGRVLGGGA